jgi:hypothetical protein
MAATRPDLTILFAAIFTVPYLILTKRKYLLKNLLLSANIAAVWFIIGHRQYSYNFNYLTISSINFYPFFAWSLGLFGIFLIYSFLAKKKYEFWKKFILYSSIYWVLLIAFETLGYHVFNIQNLGTAAYSGLPLCNCIHAPWWMQFAYFVLGPIYFSLLYILKLEK